MLSRHWLQRILAFSGDGLDGNFLYLAIGGIHLFGKGINVFPLLGLFRLLLLFRLQLCFRLGFQLFF